MALCGFVAHDSWLTCNARPKSQHQAREAQEELCTSKGDMTELSVPGLHVVATPRVWAFAGGRQLALRRKCRLMPGTPESCRGISACRGGRKQGYLCQRFRATCSAFSRTNVVLSLEYADGQAAKQKLPDLIAISASRGEVAGRRIGAAGSQGCRPGHAA